METPGITKSHRNSLCVNNIPLFKALMLAPLFFMFSFNVLPYTFQSVVLDHSVSMVLHSYSVYSMWRSGQNRRLPKV